MKKTLLLAALAAVAMTFVSCIDALPVPEDPSKPKSIFTNAEIKKVAGYGKDGEIIDVDELKTVHIICEGNYESWKITLPEAVDMSGKKIKTTIKFSEGYDTGDNTFKIAFFSDDTHGSEIDTTSGGFTAFPTDYTACTSEKAAGDEISVVWTKDNSIEKADFTKIKEIRIVPQTGKGEVWIKNIEVVD
ncbi:MAG: hypothetical protein K6A43_09515 [Treponema sp.]|nr:hypothetical protein [Treponema sp.]